MEVEELFFLIFSVLFFSQTSWARNVYLNGVDISSARGQTLKNVEVQISPQGDVFLVAPQYEVHEEDNYTPLSAYVQGLNHPLHQDAKVIDRTGADANPRLGGGAVFNSGGEQNQENLAMGPQSSRNLKNGQDPQGVKPLSGPESSLDSPASESGGGMENEPIEKAGTKALAE